MASSTAQDVDIVSALAARSNIPELGPFDLAQHWRADKIRDPDELCATCCWNGRWEDITKFQQSRPKKRDGGITRDQLEQSASAGNFCCAVLLAVTRKFGVGSVWFDRLRGLVAAEKDVDPVDSVYVSSDISEVDIPAGAEVYPSGRHPIPDPWSEETLAWADGHIRDCILNHDCTDRQAPSGSLPTRLILIPENAENGGVCLVRDAAHLLPSSTRYAALTHCWGQHIPECLTTGDNINVYASEGISWAAIPRTFRDAIQYTRRLGLEYLWIDSICIIQGDQKDWEAESMRMFDYYSNAHVTLGSTFSADCTGGFYSERHVRASRLYLFDVLFRGSRLAVYAKRSPAEKWKLKSDEESPRSASPYHLFRRAWTYQERLTSSRLLLFTQKQALFECAAGRRLQEADAPTARTLKEVYRRLLTGAGRESPEASWAGLVNAFSGLRLSFPADKLPAFAGVAQQYLLSQPAGDEYLCGLRRSHLHCDLLWCAEKLPVDRRSEDAEPLIERPYLAPSWSWASVSGGTVYHWTGAGRKDMSTIIFKGEDLVFSEAGRFGRPVAGYIVLEGPVIDGFVRRWDRNQGSQRLELANGWEDPKFVFTPDFVDIHEYLSVDEAIEEVPVCLLQTLVSGNRLGLVVLNRNSESSRWHRIGVCIFYREDFVPYLNDLFRSAGRRVLEIE
ncbi:hypothetical protein KJ359_005705 [Pestalotiopsis sp. 9143b]|nr:hypothetical protein KJ359_005705 [Pestalotiopsis sp. 9143b]